MADHDATRPPGRGEGLPRLVTPTSRSWKSHETGESSNTASRLDVAEQTLDLPNRHVRQSSVAPAAGQGGSTWRRRLRPRSTGGFLLDNLLPGNRGHDRGHRRSLRDAKHPEAKAPSTPDSSRSSAARDRQSRLGVLSDAGSRQSTRSRQSSPGNSSGGFKGDATDAEPRQRDSATLDVDSAQVVHMALSLTESRRMAARRNVSRGTPPRLVSLPDGTSGSNLRQLLQQQRRASRNMSPKPQPSPRISSAVRLNSPLQSTFDTGHDGQYRYHFSSSTLARAQKAKEHLELLAEYRRLLEALPPLKPGLERCLTGSPPSSPLGGRAIKFGSHKNAAPPLGRQYNPLQYIRNRKVRARERKVIDEERQGFGDVESVRAWVDRICQSSSSPNMSSDEAGPAFPAFPIDEDPGNQTSPTVTAPRPAARVRRPRVDWFIEPCDLIADTYWLEQDPHHKHLIEDRRWRKIFPPADISRPMSHGTAEPSNRTMLSLSLQTEGHPDVKADTDITSTKHRARQKLHNIRSFPHRHSGSLHNHHHHDFMRLMKDSASDLSDSGNEGKDGIGRRVRPVRSGTLSSNTNDLLEKQMLEMVAKDARERGLAEAAVDTEQIVSPTVMSPDRFLFSQPSSRFHSRKGSMADASDSDRKGVTDKSQVGSPRQYQTSHQAPDVFSIGEASSLPTSPVLRAPKDVNRDESEVVDTPLSPLRSRHESPTRNPLSKIKHIILDRNGDTESGVHPTEMDQDGDRQTSAQESAVSPEIPSPPARRQTSSANKLASERTPELRKMHRKSGSLRLRPDDTGVGLRGILKGPRLNTVIRGGVSKLGDMLWRKDGSSEPPLEVDSTDESEGERARGRQNPPLSLPRGQPNRTHDDGRQAPKHFLDSMPDFNHAPGIHHMQSAGNGCREETPNEAAIESRQSSRVDLLKPPRVDVRTASSSVSRPASMNARLGESDVSEPESGQESIPESVREADKHPNDMLRPSGSDHPGQRQGRHWSIADMDFPKEQTRLSRREIARMRVLILSSGIKAMEISRRANELHRPFGIKGLAVKGSPIGASFAGIEWADIARFGPAQKQLCEDEVALCELYPFAARTLGSAIQASNQRWQAAADRFATKTSPGLQRRIGELRSRLVDDLSEMTRRAADEADETGRDLALGQPLKVKHVVDTIEKMLRRRQRRLRWLRRALWLMVEWLLVGFMWYVWFVVMILRVFLGLGKGFWRGVRWLLWM